MFSDLKFLKKYSSKDKKNALSIYPESLQVSTLSSGPLNL